MSKNSGLSPRSRHPLHPIFTHFPMALLIISSLWDLLGFWRGDPFWWGFAFWSIVVGLSLSFLTLVTGLIDYVKIPQGGIAETVALRHMVIVIVALLFYGGSVLFRYYSPLPESNLFVLAITLSLMGLISLLVGGWYGGELVYRHGVGRIAEPSNHNEK